MSQITLNKNYTVKKLPRVILWNKRLQKLPILSVYVIGLWDVMLITLLVQVFY